MSSKREDDEGSFFKPLNLSKIKTYSIKERKNLSHVNRFAKPVSPQDGMHAFFESLPEFLASANLRKVIDAIVHAHRKKRPVVMALGAHVIKCGLSPLIIDLMNRRIITALAMHGASAIHDYEVSLIGATSEDVAETLKDGSFGMVKETAEAFQAASAHGIKEGKGLGRALGDKIVEEENTYHDLSLLAWGARLNIPTTVHVALGTDTIHMHPNVSGRDLGESSHTDFKILASVVSQLEGGVWLNVGSAVILPEVFLKALCIARNLGHKVENFVTVNMDMIQHYRPQTNVLRRPTPHGYAITGHHEIMLPVLRMGVLTKLGRGDE
ncbi:MAG: hypothetical protein DCC43_03760 [Candidatus Brocadia sp.]|uniref:Deoxyhypusine synthase n=1 Tax=Candidatus Brocadia fulgida TaxID=380242 RepID=A0A0M2V146_9BACT|nr:MAG: hypothetical protein BROFUL_00859 [Candidatus Brocadia fulgida]MCC6324610.1 hypothetical protein [Candidatus Brocadia sp.]MCE7910300.1 hypothetical protein [Candidatus Brocadia sp. AMX3]MBV6519596.1 hypothetical protein [Candidatus Brocadia fulgida]MDG5995568.1 hypothetical protein [Candidatus Brocadia sp.]